jgi:hypothetical protein
MGNIQCGTNSRLLMEFNTHHTDSIQTLIGPPAWSVASELVLARYLAA